MFSITEFLLKYDELKEGESTSIEVRKDELMTLILAMDMYFQISERLNLIEEKIGIYREKIKLANGEV